MRTTLIPAASLMLLLSTGLAGCDDNNSDDKKAAKGDDAKDDPKDDPKDDAKDGDAKGAKAEAAKEEPEEVAREMIEHDLSSADPIWEGWVAEGPKEAKVMKDGVKGARIAAGGRGKPQWDVSWAPTKKDLAQLKENLQKGAENSDGKMTITFTKDEPDRLEWTSDGYGTKTYSFTLHMTAEGVGDVTCANNIMAGIESEQERELYMASCATLDKKG